MTSPAKQAPGMQDETRPKSVSSQSPLNESGPLWVALAGAMRVRDSDPDDAERQILAVLKIAPCLQQALQLLIDGRRARGDIAGARSMLEAMASEMPERATVHFELGLVLAEMGEAESAMRSLRRVVTLEPKHPQAWRVLGDALVQTGDTTGAADAYVKQVESSAADLTTLEAVAALGLDQAEVAGNVLHEYLNAQPSDLNALEILASLNMRAGEFESAESLYARALDLAPSFLKARLGYISALHQQLKSHEEIEQVDILLADDPDNAEYQELKTLAMSASGKVQEAIANAEGLVQSQPLRPNAWLTYAHVLRVAGRQKECIDAYRKAIALDPLLYEAWWGLANLKTFRFGPAEVKILRDEPSGKNLSDESREYRYFSLGKAFEDTGDYKEAFEQYRLGNALVRARHPYDVKDVVEGVRREKRRYTRAFFEAHARDGLPTPDPIFILGLPRSGSTLVEQILASHSLVEGCGELSTLPSIARRLEASQKDRSGSDGDGAEAYFRGENLKALGQEYLDSSKPFRKLALPYFTDKMPSNFHHLGLIFAALPNAKVIDTRRHPLDCGLSNFKQIFPNGRDPSYNLADIGRYYSGYVELLAHFDRVLPGRIHRVVYEDMVQYPEREIRLLLDYCGLPFEGSCLRFYETERGIRTISSEQVRKPVYKDSVAQWRNYEEWLGPLKAALGPVLDAYPAVPDIY